MWLWHDWVDATVAQKKGGRQTRAEQIGGSVGSSSQRCRWKMQLLLCAKVQFVEESARVGGAQVSAEEF